MAFHKEPQRPEEISLPTLEDGEPILFYFKINNHGIISLLLKFNSLFKKAGIEWNTIHLIDIKDPKRKKVRS